MNFGALVVVSTTMTGVSSPSGATATAVVAADAGGSVVQLVADGLDPSVTYALWLTPPGGT